MDEAQQRGWTVISMKDDWNRIFPSEHNKSNRVPPTARACDLITMAVLAVLLTPRWPWRMRHCLPHPRPIWRSTAPFNNGEDVTRARNLFQLRQRYERLPDAEGREPEKWVTMLRADLWTCLGDGWKLYGRIDHPLFYSDDVTSRFNPNGHNRFGQGDLLTEVAVIASPPTARLGYGLGTRVVWPTAGLMRRGTASDRSAVSSASRYSLPEITPGSFVLPQVIYLNSIASRNHNDGRADVNQLNIQPKFNVSLPDDWYF